MNDLWDQWHSRLVTALEGLAEGGFVNTGGPSQTVDRGPGLFGRARKPTVVPGPVFLVLHMGSHFWVEASVLSAPGVEESGVGLERLVSLGWASPGDPEYADPRDADVASYVPVGECERVADLAVATYQLIGVDAREVDIEAGV